MHRSTLCSCNSLNLFHQRCHIAHHLDQDQTNVGCKKAPNFQHHRRQSTTTLRWHAHIIKPDESLSSRKGIFKKLQYSHLIQLHSALFHSRPTHLVEADECHEQADVRLGEHSAGQEALCAEGGLTAVQRSAQLPGTNISTRVWVGREGFDV